MPGMWPRGIDFLINLILFFSLSIILFCDKSSKREKLVVVATIPDIGDWVQNVGNGRVEVFTLIKGTEDPHNYDPRPNDWEKITQARVLLRIGLGLEEWLEGLIENAHNSRLKVVTLSSVSDVIKEEGGIHSSGNPHVWLDPANAQKAIMAIAQVLSEVDSAGRDLYYNHSKRYARAIDSVTGELKELVRMCPRRKFVAMHNSWLYFCRAFGFEMVEAIEPIPGEEPSLRNIAELIKVMKRDSVEVIVVEPYQNRDIAEAIAKETGAKIVVLGSITGSLPQVSSYLQLLNYNVRTLVNNL